MRATIADLPSAKQSGGVLCFPSRDFFASMSGLADHPLVASTKHAARFGYAPHPSQQSPARGFLMSEHIHHVTDASFGADVLQSEQPVLIDYWAEWCGPCKMIAPLLDDIANDYAGRLKVVKLNIDDNQKTPASYGIRGIPTLMIFKNGQPAATKVGALSKLQLTTFIDNNL